MQVTAEYLRKNQNVIFIYGDNLIRKGYGGAAKLRDESNAYGFITKKYPNNKDSSFFTVKEYVPIFKKQLTQLVSCIKSHPNKTFLISRIGGGLANKHNIFETVIKPNISKLKKYKNVKLLFD